MLSRKQKKRQKLQKNSLLLRVSNYKSRFLHIKNCCFFQPRILRKVFVIYFYVEYSVVVEWMGRVSREKSLLIPSTISSGNQLHCKKKCAKSKSTLSVLFVSLYPYCIVSDCHTRTKTENPPTHHASFFQFILKIQMRVVHTVFFPLGSLFPPKKKEKRTERERDNVTAKVKRKE